MCGIVGFAGEIHVSHEKAFKTMLILDVIRGHHSTGVASVKKHTNEVTVVKSVGHALDLIETKKYEELMKQMHRVLIGHNRWATIGKVNKSNAHPFEFDKVVGVHNGTLSQRHNLFNQSQYDTDSESLYSHINEYGIEDAIRNTQGAWALCWWDKEDNTINFLRNNERPLYIAFCKNTRTIAWASEAWMIEVACAKDNIELEGDPIKLAEDTWLSYEVTDKGIVAKGRTRQVKGPEKVTYLGKPGGGSRLTTGHSYHKSSVSAGDTSPKSPSHLKQGRMVGEITGTVTQGAQTVYTVVVEGKPDSKFSLHKLTGQTDHFVAGDFISFEVQSYMYAFWVKGSYHNILDPKSIKVVSLKKSEPEYRDHQGNVVSISEWRKAYGQCAWCSTDIEPTDEHKLSRDGQALCQDCSKDPEVAQYIH